MSTLPPLQPQAIPDDWWAPSSPRAFFGSVYREGDDSLEGHLVRLEMTRPERTARECSLIERLTRPPRGATIVDCPCGVGRHAVDLAARGYRIVGVDIDAEALEKARELAASRVLSLPPTFCCADMRSIPVADHQADCLVNMFFSFGFFLDDNSNARVMHEFARVLKPGGTLLVHTDVNPERLRRGVYGDRAERTLSGGRTLLVQEQYIPHSGRLLGKWMIRRGDVWAEEASYSVRIYSDEELERMCVAAGFRDWCRYNIGPEGICDDPLSEEVAYVARR